MSPWSRHLRGLKRGAAPEEGSVDAAAVDDEPARPGPFERAVGRAGDEELRVRLKCDVIDIGEAADGYVPVGQRDAAH